MIHSGSSWPQGSPGSWSFFQAPATAPVTSFGRAWLIASYLTPASYTSSLLLGVRPKDLHSDHACASWKYRRMTVPCSKPLKMEIDMSTPIHIPSSWSWETVAYKASQKLADLPHPPVCHCVGTLQRPVGNCTVFWTVLPPTLLFPLLLLLLRDPKDYLSCLTLSFHLSSPLK